MKNLKNQKEFSLKIHDILFIKSVAVSCGKFISYPEALKAIKICGDDYTKMISYFSNIRFMPS